MRFCLIVIFFIQEAKRISENRFKAGRNGNPGERIFVNSVFGYDRGNFPRFKKMRHRISGVEVARSRTRLPRTDIKWDGSITEHGSSQTRFINVIGAIFPNSRR